MMTFIKRFIPHFLFSAYHFSLAKFSAWWYGHPSEKLIVIGVTGTKGKTTTSTLIADLLEDLGHRTGLTSTAVMRIGQREWLNNDKMTMPGRFKLQRLMSEMVKAGCEYAVIESSSEGVLQSRHVGIHYDAMVFTNLSPEHVERHGSYEAYRDAKAELFRHLKNAPTKIIGNRLVKKRVVLNRDDVESKFFSAVNAGEDWWFGLATDHSGPVSDRDVVASITGFTANGLTLSSRGRAFSVPLLGKMNAYNVLAAVTTGLAFGFSYEVLAATAEELKPVPGRQEFIQEGQSFTVMVDYAYEPTAIANLYSLLAIIPHQRIIHVLGPTGGGRDRWRRPVMGELAANHAHVVIGTTDDPYDDDPEVLAGEMLDGATKVQADGRAVEILKIIDRRLAIREALRQAQPNDLVLITGKGAEQKMVIKGKLIPWDDRQVAREELRRLASEIPMAKSQ